MAPANLIKHILKDIKVELKDEFDKNFERKAFFHRKVGQEKIPISARDSYVQKWQLKKIH